MGEDDEDDDDDESAFAQVGLVIRRCAELHVEHWLRRAGVKRSPVMNEERTKQCIFSCLSFLQCSDAVNWMTGRASGL